MHVTCTERLVSRSGSGPGGSGIVEVAMAYFGTHGYEAARIEEIVAKYAPTSTREWSCPWWTG